MFTALDGAKGRGIDKSQAHLKAYAMGSTSDVQPQYPVTISADAVVDGRQVHWDRSLNTSTGQTTIKGAKDLVAVATDYHREKQTDIFKTNTRTNGYIDSVDGTANIKLMTPESSITWEQQNWIFRISMRLGNECEYRLAS